MEKILYISWMHCPSCSLLICDTIEGIDGMRCISLTENGVLTCSCEDDACLDLFAEKILLHGYRVTHEAPSDVMNYRFRRQELIWFGCFWLGLWFLLDRLDIAWYASSLGSSGTLGVGEMFLLWVIASLSTCLALVWGFVLMWWSLQWWTKESFFDALRHQWLFQIGRLWWYALGWLILWWVWSALLFSPLVNWLINMLVSVLLLFMWWNMIGRWHITLPGSGWKDALMGLLKRFSRHRWWGVIVWALTFLLPCGFTQLAQINALSTGSPMQWALLLLVFALGTFPILFLLWVTGNRFQANAESIGYKVLWVSLVVLSLFLIENALLLLGFSW